MHDEPLMRGARVTVDGYDGHGTLLALGKITHTVQMDMMEDPIYPHHSKVEAAKNMPETPLPMDDLERRFYCEAWLAATSYGHTVERTAAWLSTADEVARMAVSQLRRAAQGGGA